MKKIIRIFLNICLVTTTVTNVSGCQWSCTNYYEDYNQTDISCNYIVPDINSRTTIINSDRNDNDNLKTWLEQEERKSERWLNVTKRKKQFVANLERKIKYNASPQSIQAFNKLMDNKTQPFQDFDTLNTELKTKTLSNKNTIKIDWEGILEELKIPFVKLEEIKNELLKFYNIFATVYGKNNTLKMLYRIATVPSSRQKVVAFVKPDFLYKENSFSFIQIMGVGPNVFNPRTINFQYHIGWWSNNNILQILAHEYGHVLGNFLRLDKTQRQKINSFADNDPDSWWNRPLNINQELKLFNEVKINDETDYMITSLARNTGINVDVYQKLLAYGLVRSNYGRQSHRDLFAEAFSQWLLTTETQRNIAWEKLDQFFRIELPDIINVN